MAKDVLEILKNDHDKVDDLLTKLEGSDGEDAKDVLKTIREEVVIHSKVEEEIVYSAYRKNLGDEEAAITVEESRAEHDGVEHLIGNMIDLDPDGPTFKGRAAFLKESIQHHVEDEEKEMFPKLKSEVPKEEREKLGEQVLARKKELEKKAASKELYQKN